MFKFWAAVSTLSSFFPIGVNYDWDWVCLFHGMLQGSAVSGVVFIMTEPQRVPVLSATDSRLYLQGSYGRITRASRNQVWGFRAIRVHRYKYVENRPGSSLIGRGIGLAVCCKIHVRIIQKNNSF